MEKIKFHYTIDDNILILTPEKKIQDNSLYTIKIKELYSKINKEQQTKDLKIEVTSKMTPAYCTLNDVYFLHEMFNIPEKQILYDIREASKYADYMRDAKEPAEGKDITLPMREFVKTKVTMDLLTRAYITKAAGYGTRGTLGVITYQDTENYNNSIGDLLDRLKNTLKGWSEALKGYEREGRVTPKYSKKAFNQSEPTSFSQIINDWTRDVPTNV